MAALTSDPYRNEVYILVESSSPGGWRDEGAHRANTSEESESALAAGSTRAGENGGVISATGPKVVTALWAGLDADKSRRCRSDERACVRAGAPRPRSCCATTLALPNYKIEGQ